MGIARLVKALSWQDQFVPLEARGVHKQWLIDFVRSESDRINSSREFHQPSVFGFENDPAHLPVYLTTQGLVDRVIKPLTQQVRSPLWAFVPPDYQGRPTTFLSHTWSSLLFGPTRQQIGTLDLLRECAHDFVWIDFVSYNQHTFEAIALDMQRIVRSIGSLTVCATPSPLYSRCWCLWELFCAHHAGASVDLLLHGGYRNDKIMAVNSLYRSFAGVERASSSVASDRDVIRDACLAHFGSVQKADEEFESMLRERLSGEWCELQDRNEKLKFSPTPLIFGDQGAPLAPYEPYFEPGLLDSFVFGSGNTVRELFAKAGVYLGDREGGKAATKEMETAYSSSPERIQQFFQCLLAGDTAGVKDHLHQGCDPEARLSGLMPIGIAAREGNLAILDLLIAAGAAVEPEQYKFSPLRLAADKGHFEIVKRLLECGAAVDSQDAENGWTALMWAASGGHLEIARLLLLKGAHVNHAGSGKRGAALHLAASNGHAEMASLLLAQGANLHAVDYRGFSALHLASYKGHCTVARELLQHGADPSLKCNRGDSSWDLAMEFNKPEIATLLKGATTLT